MFSIVKVARDQTQPGSLLARLIGGKMRDPGNEVAMKGVWNGDEDLGNGKLQELRRQYDERVTLVAGLSYMNFAKLCKWR